jgi:membrane protein implicated in regulation of membrane protease activity
VLVNLLFLAADFFGRGEYKTSNPSAEMFAPYGRIVTLHVAIILGAGLAFTLDDPLLGVLLLILIRVLFGILTTVMRRRKRDTTRSECRSPGNGRHGR